ncbi:MAG: hypothetical protein OXG44_06050 [Gammaproteobacteria bacterium]|nr:hypothetical protein [Gammaproteobacteria bacterium]
MIYFEAVAMGICGFIAGAAIGAAAIEVGAAYRRHLYNRRLDRLWRERHSGRVRLRQ